MISEQILKYVHDAQHERNVRIMNAWKCYQGDYPKSLKPTRSDPQAKDNIAINFAALVVDKGVSFLLGKDLDFECAPGKEEGPVDVWLDECWTENKKMSLLHMMAMNGGVTGDVFVRIMLPDAASGKKFPRVMNLDPSTVLPIWDMDDYENVIGWLRQWNAKDPETGRAVVRRQIYEPQGTSWSIRDQISRGDSKIWIDLETTVWPFAWSPILHCQNLPMANEYFGLSDIEAHVLQVNDAINFVMSNIQRIIRIHAHPKTVAAGLTAKQIEIGVDDVIVLGNTAATLKNLEMQSDLSSSIEMYRALKELYHAVARTPEIATGKIENVGPLSGVALKILYQSLIEKNQTKQIFFGDLLTETNDRLREVGKQKPSKVAIHWQDPLPHDVKDEAEAALVLEQVGVSKHTALTELGYDPEDEASEVAKEAKTANELGAQMMDAFDKGGLPGQDNGGDDGSSD